MTCGLHFGLDILAKSLELFHVSVCGRPADAKALALVGLGDLNKGCEKEIMVAAATCRHGRRGSVLTM